MITIRDIAKQSGYSVATVSRVLNNKNYVSERARKEIQKTIQEMNYVPNNIARNLNNGRTFTIGFVLPHIKHAYFIRVLNGAMQASFESNYHIVILPSEYDEDKERAFLENLRNKTYDGLIFTSHALPVEYIARYTQYGPIVCCEDTQHPNISAVFTKKEPALLQAFQLLKNKQKKHVAILLSRHPSISPTSQQIVNAYEVIYEKKLDENYLVTNIFDYEDGYRCAETLVSQNINLDAIVANLDDVAAGFRQYFIDNNLDCPYLVGQENQLSSHLLNIPTIDYHLETIGLHAFNLVSTNAPVQKIIVDSHFIPR